MNTNALKKFAQEARRKLLEQTGARLDYALHADTAALREKAAQVQALREALREQGREALIDRVAYTWFNRLVALRFLDANDYQPLDLRVLSPREGRTLPELLDEAKRGHIPDELPVDKTRIFQLLDGRLPSNNPQNEAFRELLTGACNYLHQIFPFLFERINDYTELLLPEDLTSEFSIVHEVVEGMDVEDCQEVEIIGWLYQFYITDRRDEVFASKSKVKKEDIPSVTQLFTPRWIVEYMVQNTLGKLWLQNRPHSRLREHMPYFIESPAAQSEDFLRINSPEEIRLLDQACGSGHILVYAFDLLTKIYEEEGFNPSEIPALIIRKNLYGFEIDERAAQLSGLALLLKARAYQRRLFRKSEVPEPNILCFRDLRLKQEEVKDALQQAGLKPSDALLHDLRNIEQATNFGSLIVPHAATSELEQTLAALKSTPARSDVFLQHKVEQLTGALRQLLPLAGKYHCVVDNPPYMGSGGMNQALSDFVKTNYPDSKADLMACFMECGLGMLEEKGFLGMINQHSWMFLSSYEALRKKLIETVFFDSLLHLGPRTFPEIGGEVVQNASFTFWKVKPKETGVYIRLVDYDKSDLKRTKTLEAIQNPKCGWFFTAHQKDFEKIPGWPIGYWLSERVFELFGSKNSISSVAEPRIGLATGRNNYYMRNWFEISFYYIGFGLDRESAKNKGVKWFPYNKGGKFRRWYGNREYVINWENDGHEMQNTLHPSGDRVWAHNFNLDYIFKKHFGWSDITTGGLSFRVYEDGFLFDSSGTSAFLKSDNRNFILGYLNTKFVSEISDVLNPTFHFTPGDFNCLPFIESNSESIDKLVETCLDISTKDWDSDERSWDFGCDELLRINKPGNFDLQETYDLYQQYWTNKFHQLHRNEEELNRQFIEIYGLQEELTPDVPLEEITILQDETRIENGKLVFDAKEVFAQFISYAVGCMFGRYSLDKEGLVLANQGETIEDYFKKVHPLNPPPAGETFLPDADNIIPILDDEWFEDDIVGRFYEFLKATFGEANFAKNLAFLEEQIGKDIRKYFVKDFYADHVRRYKNRPIYWLFSSQQGSFNVLVYLHRYTPDTLHNILNKYLREYKEKLRVRRENLRRLEATGTGAEKTKAIKEIDRIDKVLLELDAYEREVLYPLATERIAIDLDDGVLVNYNKFGKAVKEMRGLNDPATKKKVREFDWIDTSQIRD